MVCFLLHDLNNWYNTILLSFILCIYIKGKMSIAELNEIAMKAVLERVLRIKWDNVAEGPLSDGVFVIKMKARDTSTNSSMFPLLLFLV